MREAHAMTALDRADLRRRRASMPRSSRRDAAAAATRSTLNILSTIDARRVGAYVATEGELDPAPTVRALWACGVAVYLPIVASMPTDRVLAFAVHAASQPLEPGSLGIDRPPASAPLRSPLELDAVLLPLVAFDDRGTRAGRGAGYYDTTFAARIAAAAPPLLIGLAYHWQQVDRLTRNVWDVPLDVVITDRSTFWSHPR